MRRHWMYNADHRSQEFIEGVHSFLCVAEENKRDGFMCYPCAICKNLKEYALVENRALLPVGNPL